ncbi:fimbrial biogenesis chaperone [Candidatus Venteria ishoeyi]|uniref:Pili assembly chaperone N-terminal domain-containing protein n=1 Tax=Candidatus Venteria ishoeyi TaxID=1899563 RepID=A0A1H6F4G5_9GAMM|nr:fimbria/pilus periplasmic chaperone [Candidatus Venteria ishoeyi]SEH05020.1 Uncharacterised protein [Candidatus Venteria ishoeyi]
MLKKLGILLLLSYFSLPVFSANLAISPTSVVLSPKHNTSSLTFTNRSNKPVNLQLFLKTWHQDELGKTQLSDSRDVVVFPKMLKIEPGQERPIRVGFRGKWPKIERSFRIFADELPTFNAEKGTTGVFFPVRLSIPLFVRDQSDVLSPEIKLDSAQTYQGQLRLGVQNQGRQHVALSKISVKLQDQHGQTIGDLQDSGGRILAQGLVFFDIPLAVGVCKKLHTAVFEVKIGQDIHEQQLELNKQDCTKQ